MANKRNIDREEMEKALNNSGSNKVENIPEKEWDDYQKDADPKEMTRKKGER